LFWPISLYIEALAIEIGFLYNVVIKQRDTADPLARKGGRDHGNDPARPDTQHVTVREDPLIEAGNIFMTLVFDRVLLVLG